MVVKMDREQYAASAAHWQHDAYIDWLQSRQYITAGNYVEAVKYQHAAAFCAMIARNRLFKLIGNGDE